MKSVVIDINSTKPYVKNLNKPNLDKNKVLIKTHKVGVDGTDNTVIENINSRVSQKDYLVLGHEAVGVVEKSKSINFEKGDVVVPYVRRPNKKTKEKYITSKRLDLAPYDEVDECGINNRDGFMSEYFVSKPEYLVKIPKQYKEIGYLIEPISIIEKGISSCKNINQQIPFEIRDLLILGNGKIGCLAAKILSKNYNVTVYSLEGKRNPKSRLIRDNIGTYISKNNKDIKDISKKFDLIIDTTGEPTMLHNSINILKPCGIILNFGLSPKSISRKKDISKLYNKIVLENNIILGSINSSLSHYKKSIQHLNTINDEFIDTYESNVINIDNYNSMLFDENSIKSVLKF